MAAGLLWSFGLATGFSVGLIILPLAAIVLLSTATRAPHAREAMGFVLGVAVIAAAVGVFAKSSDAASGQGLPRRVGPIYVVPTGSGTAVRVWRTADGYCVLAYRIELIDRAFCIATASLDRGGPMFSCLCGQRRGTSLVVGTVKASVVRGQKTDRRGVAAIQLYAAPQELDTSLRFFRTVVRSGSPPKWRVDFYNRRGKIVGTVGQGF
jgi:hypothetical protein